MGSAFYLHGSFFSLANRVIANWVSITLWVFKQFVFLLLNIKANSYNGNVAFLSLFSDIWAKLEIDIILIYSKYVHDIEYQCLGK